jgi:hypothetical protein
MNNNLIEVPILFVAFNRPDTTKIVFQNIREAKPSKIYLALDGPRQNIKGELQLVEKVKSIIQNVDWPCEKHFKFNARNKGAEITISSAISWVLEKEEYVIIIEDDIIAPLSFLKFAEEMLIKYKDDERIGLVSGCNFTPMLKYNEPDYFFSKYGHISGWATWKRVWKYYNLNTVIKNEHLSDTYLKTFCYSNAEVNYYKKKFLTLKENGIGNSTWDNIANYIFWTHHFLCIVPRVNLTSNIGIYGLHSKGKTKHHYRAFDKEFLIKNYPLEVTPNVKYDLYHFNNYIKPKKEFIFELIKKTLKFLLKSFN